MFKISELRKIFGPKRDEVTGDWRKLRSEELRDMYSSMNVIRVIKSRIRGRGHWECIQGFGGET